MKKLIIQTRAMKILLTHFSTIVISSTPQKVFHVNMRALIYVNKQIIILKLILETSGKKFETLGKKIFPQTQSLKFVWSPFFFKRTRKLWEKCCSVFKSNFKSVQKKKHFKTNRNCLFYRNKPKLFILQFHIPKMLVIQFHTSNVWKNASHTIFVQFQKIIEKKIRTSFCGCLNLINQSGDEKQTKFFFFGKK